MACTQQSATDYFRNNRPILITHLQNFPLITENLYQRRVFNDHEVDALKAERTDYNKARFILDSVTKKGESACYELLRILDMTRKRTLHPDSHFWISCFPFREDTETDFTVGTKPCHNYMKQIKAKAKSIVMKHWRQHYKCLKDKTMLTFIPLVLDTDAYLNSAQNKIKLKSKKIAKCRPKKLKSFIPVQTHKLSPEHLLCSHEKEMLVIGKPGIGKTAVVLQMLSLWSSKDNRKLDYMFYFDESTFTTISNLISLESLLFHLYLKPPEKDRKEVLQDIEENSENVIIMFDGISTLEHNPIIKKIIERDLLPEAKIVITCRSDDEDDFLFADWPTCRVYVKGFSEESIRTYLTQMTGSNPELLNIVLNNHDLISLCHVPMYAFIVAYCIFFSVTAPEHPVTVTEIYVHILRQDLKKPSTKNVINKYITDVKDQLLVLMKSAFIATMQKTVNITDAVSDDIEISKVFLRKIAIENTPTSVKSSYAFLHSTVQEFFSALWLLGNPGEIDEVLQNCLTKEQKHMKHVIPFLCGLLSEQNLKLLKNLFTEDQIRRTSDGIFTKVLNTFLQPQPNGQLGGDDDEVSVLLFVCQCLYESQSPEACLLFLEKMNYDLDLSGEDLDPYQCCAVSYVISQSREKQVHLSLEDCSVSDTGIQMILRFKSHFRDKSSTLCHVWRSVLSCETPRDFTGLLDVCGKEIHLPVSGEASMFRKAEEVMSQRLEKISLHLHCTEDTQRLSDDLCNMVLKTVPYVKFLRFEFPCDSLIQPDHRLQIIESIHHDLLLKGAGFERQHRISELPTCLLMEDHFRCSVCTDVLKEPVSIPCGHSYCKTCIQTYWSKPTQAGSYSCPQCRKRFNTHPALKPNIALAIVVEKLQQAGFSPALPAHCYAGPGDVVCDFCTGRKLRAVKSCLTCTASYCETHVRQHYTVAALQRHRLVEVTGDLEKTLCKRHHRGLEVFCRTDQTFICLMCMMEEHKEHDTVANISKTQHQKIPLNSFEKKTEYVIEDLMVKVENLQRANRELTYLAKLLYRGIEQDSSGIVEVSALGRHFDLGMLYDCHSDSVSSDVFLWDEDTLSSMRVSFPRPHTDVRMLEGDSLQERLRALDLTPPLRASVVAGLVEVSGASAFVNHPTQSQLQDRVTLHYRTSTRLDMLSHTLLQSAAPLSPTNQNTATHVVVAVLYGAQAFFVFDDKRESRERSPALKDVVKRNFISHSAAELLYRFNKNQQENGFFDCAFYTEFGNFKSPLSFDAAKNIYSSLQNLLGPQCKKSIPLKVWLYPVNHLNQTSACVRELSEHILVKAEKVLESLTCHLSICQDMISIYSSLGVITRFPTVKESISEISSLLQKYQSAFQRAMASCIKTTRERIEEEGRGLRDLLKWNSQSPFSPENIRQWLLNKDAEVTALQECIDKKISVKSQKELMSILKDSQNTVLCFTYTSLQGEDPFLSALKQHIGLVNTVNTHDTHLTFRLPDTSQKILSDLRSFMCTKETHEDPDHTEFIAAVVPEPQFPGSSLYLYQCGTIVSYNVNLELRPELPEILNIKQTSVAMRLQRSESQVPNQYRVEFRVVSCRSIDDMKWKIICCTVENCLVMDITPDTRYQLRYAVMDNNSLSDYSRITQFHTLPRSRPRQPTVVRQTQKSLTVSWGKADGDAPVLHHMVEYMEAGLEDWQSILTEGPECECIITPPYSTCYRVRVSAVYGEGDTSRPSEEMGITVYMWRIDLSARKASVFLEVLKLQTVKKPVELRGWSDEESEVRSFLQCLPYISQLRFQCYHNKEKKISALQFLLKLIATAAECDAATGETFTKLLTSVCS
ncbi:uncharacterized protein LOC143524655 isoform X2 [Brachyhypopomus gauderio]|uniref:uncharacterized protein LOC143524655 isoform X2 n=1 Tax=Brachyhypopomus gauderio TaxID=698409 RepID=UPI004041E09D